MRSWFFSFITHRAHALGRLRALGMYLNGRLIAMQIYMFSGRDALAIRTTYDEAYARYSPGVLLQLEWVARLHATREFAGVDSCAAADSAMEVAWGERRVVSWITCGNSRWGDLFVRLLPRLRRLKRSIEIRRDLVEQTRRTSEAHYREGLRSPKLTPGTVAGGAIDIYLRFGGREIAGTDVTWPGQPALNGGRAFRDTARPRRPPSGSRSRPSVSGRARCSMFR